MTKLAPTGAENFLFLEIMKTVYQKLKLNKPKYGCNRISFKKWRFEKDSENTASSDPNVFELEPDSCLAGTMESSITT